MSRYKSRRHLSTVGKGVGSAGGSRSYLDSASQHTESIVIEFGSSFVRVGLGGESKPRHILPVPLTTVSSSASSLCGGDGVFAHPTLPIKIPFLSNCQMTSAQLPQRDDSKSVDQNETSQQLSNFEHSLHAFFVNLYTNLLLLKPRSRRLVVLFSLPTSPLSSSSTNDTLRKTFEKVLLQKLSIPSVLFLDKGSFQTVIPYSLGKRVGLVVDVGTYEGRCSCIFEGCPLDFTSQFVPCGFESLVQRVRETRQEQLKPMKEQTIIASSLSSEEALNEKGEDPNHMHQHIQSCLQKIYNGDYMNQIAAVNDDDVNIVMECIHELYFDLTNPSSLITAFFQCLMSCPIDLRRLMARNICFCGGTVVGIPKFEQQFLSQISEIMETYENKDEKKVADDIEAYVEARSRQFMKYKTLASVLRKAPMSLVHPLPLAPNSISWVGASVASLSISNEKWIQRKDFS